MKEIHKLRFASLIRVSTEAQAKKGESLKTQKSDLELDVQALGGEIYKWFAGTEHATPEFERSILDDLIRDAQENKFNAVIVWHVDRWSRDNYKNEEYLRILRNNGIRFFVRTREYNLNDPSNYFELTLYVLIGQMQATEQNRKSIINRINRAKQGFPVSGKLPFGRIWNKRTKKWTIDEEKGSLIQAIAKRYLEEDISFRELGELYGMNPTNLHKVLCHRCGNTWVQQLTSKRNNINEIIEIPIPSLLPDEIIYKIREKSEARSSWDRKAIKHQYLFAKLIFDMDTGLSLTGTTNSISQRYYKPYQGCKHRYQVNADILEEAIINILFEVMSCKNSLKEAIFEGNPIGNEADNIKDQIEQYEKNLQRVATKIDKIIKIMVNFEGDLLNDFKEKLVTLDLQRKDFKEKISILKYQLNTLPNEEEIDSLQDWLEQELELRVRESFLRSGCPFEQLTFEEKRKIIKLLFGGKDLLGKRYGIYVKHLGGKPKKYQFVAYGKLGCIDGRIEARSGKCSAFPDIEIFTKDDKELGEGVARVVLGNNPGLAAGRKKVRECMLSERHAHHRVRLH